MTRPMTLMRPAAALPFLVLLAGTAQTQVLDLETEMPDAAVHGPDVDSIRSLAVGDLSGDGKPDFALGAPNHDRAGGANCGKVYVKFGPLAAGDAIDLSGADPPDVTITGADADDLLGYDVAIADVDRDGDGDLVVSGRWSGGREAGEVFVFFGPLAADVDLAAYAPDLPVPDATRIIGIDPFDGFGNDVDLHDVSGDDLPDLLAGAPFADGPGNGGVANGEAYVVFAPFVRGSVRDLATNPPDLKFDAGFDFDWVGWRVSGGDLNGDDLVDVAVSIPGYSQAVGSPDSGLVFVWHGPVTSLDPAAVDASVIGELTFNPTGELLGWEMEIADLDADGIDDLILASPLADVGPPNGRADNGLVTVYTGPVDQSYCTCDLSTAYAWIRGADSNDGIGRIAAADLRGDCARELVVVTDGADGPGNTRPSAGEAYVFDGPLAAGEHDLATMAADFTILGATGVGAEELLGRAVVAGDITGDKEADLVVGARGGDGPSDLNPDYGDADVVFHADGACCLGDSCYMVSQCACDAKGGLYAGDGSSCGPGPTCPLGACCLGQDWCENTTAETCEEMGGVFRGFGELCEPGSCATGACCFGGDECIEVTAHECERIPGQFQGYGTGCDQTSCFHGKD